MRSRLPLPWLAALSLLSGIALADEPYQPLVTQDGVSVFERTSPDRALPELRAQVEIDAGIYEVLAVIADVPNQTTWMHDCSEAKLVRQESETVLLIYNRTASPWPLSDRDVLLRSETTIVEPGQHVTVRFAATTDPEAPPIDGVVRMPHVSGLYDLVALSPTRTRLTYDLDADPGGSIPAWAAVRTARQTPLETMRGLRARVAATQGQYRDFVTRWSERH
jgi:hypothetical protein